MVLDPSVIDPGRRFEGGRELAAETADLLFARGDDIASARAFYTDIKGGMAKFGRSPDEPRMLAGFPVMVAESEQEAKDRFQQVQALISEDIAKQRLSAPFEADLWDVPFDEPIPAERIPAKANPHTRFFAKIAAMAHQGMTLRQIVAGYERGMKTVRGNPRQVADAGRVVHGGRRRRLHAGPPPPAGGS